MTAHARSVSMAALRRDGRRSVARIDFTSQRLFVEAGHLVVDLARRYY